VQNSSGISIKFNSEKYNSSLKPDEEISIYRIISELINNTVKHSGAKNIVISFSSSENTLILNYFDDGNGFNFEDAVKSKSTGLGLQNIISRINSFNGTYTTEHPQPKGFGLKIILPVIYSL
jgi:signal transduction histidine kinase